MLTKLKFIKNSSKEDPSLSQFGTILNVILAVYAIFFIIGLIVTNTIQTPLPYYVLMQNLNNMNVVINEVVTAARVLHLSEHPELTLSNCKWNYKDLGTTLEGRRDELCPWIKSGIDAAKVRNESYAKGNTSLILQASGEMDYSYVPQYTLEWMLGNYSKEMVYRFNYLKEEYTRIRVPGDVFDQVIQGQFEVKRFVHGDWQDPETVNYVTFWNVLGVIAASIDSLKATKTIDEASQRDWAFIISNRYNFVSFVKKMDDLIPIQANLAITNNMIFHIIMAIVSVIIGIVYYIFNEFRSPLYF